MNAATWSNGDKVYTLGAGLSLLIFYALAMQCMSTLAVVKRETKSWKWPIIMLGYMTTLSLHYEFYNIPFVQIEKEKLAFFVRLLSFANRRIT